MIVHEAADPLPNEGGRQPAHVLRSLQADGSEVGRGRGGRMPTSPRPGQPQEEILLEGREGPGWSMGVMWERETIAGTTQQGS